MGDTRGIRAGRAFVELGISDELTRGLARAAGQLRAFGEHATALGRRMALAGAAGLGAILGSATAWSKAGATIAEMSRRTGISAQTLSELGYAAAQSGSSLQAVEAATRRMQRGLVNATAGSGAAADALAALGLSAAKLRYMDPAEQLGTLLTALAAIPDPTERAARAMELFGRGGTALLPMLAEGPAALAELCAEAVRLGQTFDTQTAEQAHELEKALHAAASAAKRAGMSLGSAVAPALAQLARQFAEAAAAVGAYLRAHPALVYGAAAAATALLGLGAAIWVVGKAATTTAALFTALKTLSAVATTAGMILTGALTSPLLLAAGAAAAVAAAFIDWGAVAGSVSKYLGDTWQWLRGEFGAGLDAIAAALSSGNLAAAARVGLALLKLAWIEGTDALASYWNEALDGLASAWNWLAGSIVDVAAWTWYALRRGWAELTSWLQKTWIDAQAAIATVSIATMQQIEQAQVDQAEAAGRLTRREAAERTVAIASKYAARAYDAETRADLANKEAEAARKRTTQQAEAELAATLANVETKRAALLAAQAKSAKDRSDRAKAEVEAAKKALADAVAAANAAARTPPPAPPSANANRAAWLAAHLPALPAGAAGTGAAGTFNPWAVRGLGPQGTLDRIAAATEGTRANTRRMADELDDLGTFE